MNKSQLLAEVGRFASDSSRSPQEVREDLEEIMAENLTRVEGISSGIGTSQSQASHSKGKLRPKREVSTADIMPSQAYLNHLERWTTGGHEAALTVVRHDGQASRKPINYPMSVLCLEPAFDKDKVQLFLKKDAHGLNHMCASRPPSMASTCPLTNSPACDARYKIAGATSSGSAQRPKGT